MDRRTFLNIVLATPSLRFAAEQAPRLAPSPQWTQWGGPNRNFQTQATGLKDTWPASGPPIIWKRRLGEGYSSAAVEDGRLYTMYGKPGEEVVIALNAGTGATIWETTNSMTFQSDAGRDMGNGPHSTPLIAGDRIFTTGVAGRIQCLDKKTGNPSGTTSFGPRIEGRG